MAQITESFDASIEAAIALEKQIKASLDYYKALQTLPLPDAIKGTADFTNENIEQLLPKLDAAVLAKWRKRAIKIETVNKVLRDFEVNVAGYLTSSTADELTRQVYKTLSTIEYMANHSGEIFLLLEASIRLIYNNVEFKDLGASYLASLYYYYTGDYKALEDEVAETATKLYGDLKTAAAVIGSLVAIKILIDSMESAVAVFSVKRFAKSIAPIRDIVRDAWRAMQAGAFPQGTGRRRRDKVHRIRKRR